MVGCRRRALLLLWSGFLLSFFLSVVSVEAGTSLKLAWDPPEPNVSYTVHYGTAPGNHPISIPVPASDGTTYTFQNNLTAGTTYYFVVTATDLAGNESQSSNEVSAQPSVAAGPAPAVTSAFEMSSNSFYILQSGSQTISVTGMNFQSGAVVGLSSDVAVGATSLAGSTNLTAPITVSPSAALGARTLVLTNPDGGSGSLAKALAVVKTADINRDCRIDLSDLNILARAWNTSSSDAAYSAAADLDGSGAIDGDDLTILIAYLGKVLAVCP